MARALLEDADLLVLDEATSDLDSQLEHEVQEAIEAMDRDYAMIAIAHRLSTIENADRIYAVDDGEIIEAGPTRNWLTRMASMPICMPSNHSEIKTPICHDLRVHTEKNLAFGTK